MKWISFKDQLPPLDEWVMLYAGGAVTRAKQHRPYVFVGMRGKYSDDDYCSAHGDGWLPFSDEKLTHWAFLPEPPNDIN